MRHCRELTTLNYWQIKRSAEKVHIAPYYRGSQAILETIAHANRHQLRWYKVGARGHLRSSQYSLSECTRGQCIIILEEGVLGD